MWLMRINVIRESDIFTPGDRVVTAETPFGRLGLSICYDIALSSLVFRLRKQVRADHRGSRGVCTAVTGQAHWEALVKVPCHRDSVLDCRGRARRGNIPAKEKHGDTQWWLIHGGGWSAQLDQDLKIMVVE